MSADIDDLPRFGDNIYILLQYQEHLEVLQKKLAGIRHALYSWDLDDESNICILQSKMEKNAFDCSLKIRKRLHAPTHFTSKPDIIAGTSGVKLPKLDVHTFDGNVLNWRTFWKQFEVAVHSWCVLSNAEKPVYLQHVLKDATAKGVIEGLCQTGEHNHEAIKCLQSMHNKPRLIHQIHVCKILEIPNVKDGRGRELRRHHDTA